MSFRSTAAPLTLALLLGLTPGAAERRVPTLDDLLTLRVIGGAQISPDGARVAYTISETDFAQDAFVTHIWVADTATGRTVQLTRGDKTATSPKWSPDGKWLAFTSPRVADRNQVFAIRPDGGEAVQLTKSETPVSSFSWSRDGKTLAFTAPDAPTEAQKARKEHLGDYEVVRRDYQHVHLWTVDVEEALRAPVAGRQRTKGKDFSVSAFSWAPDDRAIAFSGTINPDSDQRLDRGHLRSDDRRRSRQEDRRSARPRQRAAVVAGRPANRLHQRDGPRPVLRADLTACDRAGRRRFTAIDQRDLR